MGKKQTKNGYTERIRKNSDSSIENQRDWKIQKLEYIQYVQIIIMVLMAVKIWGLDYSTGIFTAGALIALFRGFPRFDKLV